MLEFYRQYRANVERGIHRLSQKASEEYERAHLKVAEFINAKSDAEIIMTRNTTEGINIIANGLKWKKGEKIVTTMLEHHSNFIVWQRVREKYDVKIDVVKPNNQGLFDLADFDKAINDETRLVSVTHVSNSLGVIVPIEEIVKIAKEKNSFTLVDGAQSVPHMRVDVQKIGCDALAFSGHKMCAPTGSGALYIKEDLADEIEPLCVGGGAIEDVGLDYYRLAKGWRRFEAGTPAIAEGIGLGAAVDYLTELGMENIKAHEEKLAKEVYEGLRQIPKVEVYGPEDLSKRVALVSFNVGDLNPHDVALALDISANVMVRSGHHCALPVMKEVIHRNGTVRASLYLYNTLEEVNRFLSAVEEIAKALA
jgi:cysteine desulfurase/selenocysteine lyase